MYYIIRAPIQLLTIHCVAAIRFLVGSFNFIIVYDKLADVVKYFICETTSSGSKHGWDSDDNKKGRENSFFHFSSPYHQG